MLRSVGPDIAVLDAIVPAGLDGPIQHVETSRAIVGMNRRQQILVRKRLARLAAEERLTGVGGLQLKLRKMQFERTETAGAQRGLQQAFAFGEILKNGAGLVLATPASDGGADHAYQRCGVERKFNESDVAEHLSKPHGIRVAFGTAALTRLFFYRKIPPPRLIVLPPHQAAHI